jgi:ComF family protein
VGGVERDDLGGWLRVAASWATRVAFPEVCAGCGVLDAWMCADCAAECHIPNPLTCCQRCGHPGVHAVTCRRCQTWPTGLTAVRSVYSFAGPVRNAVHRLKYDGEHARAAWGAAGLAQLLDQLGWRPTLIVPTPLHPRRRRERGYNQSEKLATALSAIARIPTEDALERRRDTRPQVGLTADARVQNVAGAFAARRSLAGEAVLLIDDVLTTVSTLLDCARACRLAGAHDVRALTLAAGG